MTENFSEVVGDVVAFLMLVNRDGVRPRDAQARLRPLQARHHDVEMELIWEKESYDGSLHYDVLIRSAAKGTVSISFALDHGLPWPLRGVKRSTDANLLQVNGKMLTMEDAFTFLDVLWNEAPLMERMVSSCLVCEELERHPIELDDGELQVGMDGFRRLHKLFTADETLRWMQVRGLTHEQLEQQVAGSLMCAKLRQRIAKGRVEAYFESHRDELDTTHVARIECDDEAAAERVRRAAQRSTDYAEVAREGARRIVFERLRRRDVPHALDPTRVGDHFEVTLVLGVEHAVLDDETRMRIEQMLFDEWLEERRSAARVCWHWGTSDRAPSAA